MCKCKNLDEGDGQFFDPKIAASTCGNFCLKYLDINIKVG